MRFTRSTPNRTFILYPALVLGSRLLTSRGRARFSPQFLPLLVWGYLQYRLCGMYRRQRGGGGPGLERPPTDLVMSGPYRVIRNPMYLGHLIFLVGLALFARSRAGLLLAAGTAWWFDARVRGDEERLAELFGEEYDAYRRRVPRWFPGLGYALHRLPPHG
jgi:protein-S-isoprenylcysteine O-methyltransferase Ste14